MTVWQAAQSLISLLDASARRPSAASDLPRVVVAVSEASDLGAGLGGLVGTRRISDTAWSSITASRSAGVFALELWAADEAALNTLADTVMDRLVPGEAFLRLSVQSLGPIDAVPPGLRLPLGVAFVHETPVSEDTGPDGIVKTVHVELSDDFHEVMDIQGR
jgi:hypothetical protein